MFVAVGSTNKAKVEAVKEALRIIGMKAEVKAVKVDPEVPPQPVCNQTFVGAKTRAYKALRHTHADIGLGIEGGVFYYENRMLAYAVVYAASKKGVENFAFSASFPLPPSMTSLLVEGKELGEVTDIIFSTKESKQSEGAIGYLTKMHITRKDLYVQPVVIALYPFYNNVD
ncbi:MAG: inosine/xanthosine triphosphatase [Sulfolobaceae archaeon]